MAYRKKNIDSIFADVLMVLLIVTLIMLVSIDISKKKGFEDAVKKEPLSENVETIELPTNSETSVHGDPGIIIEMNSDGYQIRFSGEELQISPEENLVSNVKKIAKNGEPDVILLASPQDRFQNIIDVLKLLDAGIEWTTPQVGTF